MRRVEKQSSFHLVNIYFVLPYLGGNISVYIEQVQVMVLIHMFLTLYKVPFKYSQRLNMLSFSKFVLLVTFDR